MCVLNPLLLKDDNLCDQKTAINPFSGHLKRKIENNQIKVDTGSAVDIQKKKEIENKKRCKE